MVSNQYNGQGSLWRHDPPFRADQVGSLLRPKRLKEARQKKAEGIISAEELRNIEDEEIIRAVEKQKEIGLTAITDGEYRRSWWHFDFLEELDGVERYTSESGIQFQHTQTQSRGIKVTGKIGFSQHPMLEHFTFLNQVVGQNHMAKMTIPSPSMLHLRGKIDTDIYKKDEEQFFHDLAQAYKQAINAFYQAGCRYLQLDDTSWGVFCSQEQREELRRKGHDPDQLQVRYAQTINEAVADRPKDLKITMHICRGNFRSTWFASGGYEPVAELLFGTLKIDGFFLEYDSERAGDFGPLRFVNRPDLYIVLGLITSKVGQLENPDEIKRRVDEATQYVDLNQLCLSTQCGFASTEDGNLLSEDEQWQKLQLVVNLAHEIWK
jgi:5-methyltetrahydropteroyltriglutamate--homocysteine methyltransferase